MMRRFICMILLMTGMLFAAAPKKSKEELNQIPQAEFEKIPSSEQAENPEVYFMARFTNKSLKSAICARFNVKAIFKKDQPELARCKTPETWLTTLNQILLAEMYDIEDYRGHLQSLSEGDNPYRQTPLDKKIQTATQAWKILAGAQCVTELCVNAMALKEKYECHETPQKAPLATLPLVPVPTPESTIPALED